MKKIFLRKLNLKKDISPRYQTWMNDTEVHRFTEQRYVRHSLNDIRTFVRRKNNSKQNLRKILFP